jgi:hypothetical protein
MSRAASALSTAVQTSAATRANVNIAQRAPRTDSARAQRAVDRPGAALDAQTRTLMESRFHNDFADVRIHTDADAANSARALHARAYTAGRDIVFGAGEYRPLTTHGRKLLAHELAHVVQLGQSGPTDHAEERADHAASRITQGSTVAPQQLGAARPGIHRQPDATSKSTDEPAAKPEFKPITLPLSLLTLQFPQLQPPSLLKPSQPPPIIPIPKLSLGSGGASSSLSPSSSGGSTFKSPVVTTPPQTGPLAPTAQSFTPPAVPASGASTAPAPDLPSRIGVTDFGNVSLGLRFGLPVAPQLVPGTPPDRRPQPGEIPGAGPSALAVSDYQFELLDMRITGKVPRGLDAVDKGDLIKATFGIVATHIAPALINSLAKSVAGKPGADYHLDLTLTGDFKGAGITFSMPFDKPPKRYKRSSKP